MDDNDIWKTLVGFAGVVILTMAAAIRYLVAWIRRLYAEAKTQAAEEIRDRDQRHDRLLDVILSIQEKQDGGGNTP